MNKIEFIEELLSELSYRSDEGYPILTKSTHITLISEILDEWGLTEIKNTLIENLLEAGEQTLDPKEKEKAKQMGLVWKGKGWGKEEDDFVSYNVENGKLVKVDRDDNDGEAGPNIFSKDSNYTAPDLENDSNGDSGTSDSDKTNVSENDQKTIDGFKTRVEKSSMSAEAKVEANQIIDKLSVMFDSSKSKEEIVNTLSELNISVSSNRKKLYLDDMRKHGGGLYKILGDGTKGAISAINKISEFMELPEDDNKMSIEIEAAAKPDLGSQNIRSVFKKTSKGFTEEIDDVNVEKLFKTPPLDRIDTTKFKSVFGPTDDNGNLLTPSSQHSKEYLKFSIDNNISVDNTINVLEKYAAEGKISEDLANSVKAHKQRMSDVLSNMEIPSQEASDAVDLSYAKMFDELMKQNQDLASRMLKQFAEMRLYDSEIAKGDEAYLPGDGSFPAGDKLVFQNGEGGTEMVSFVSVKYGKNGDVYGCPANSKALQTLHPDKTKRERQGQYIGEGGYTLAVNDELISDVKTTKTSIKSMIDEMGDVQGIFDDTELDVISDVVYKTKERVNQLKSQYEKDGKMDKVGWSKLQKDILKDPTMVQLNSKLKEVVSVEKFSKLIGSRNGRVASKYDFGAAHFISGLSLANQIVTSNGYEGVTHNKQYYDNGTLKNTTVAGTTDRDEWYINFRMYRTAGRSGGGAQVSYIGPELKEKFGDSQFGEIK
jgi:hypothetical protein